MDFYLVVAVQAFARVLLCYDLSFIIDNNRHIETPKCGALASKILGKPGFMHHA